MAPVTTERSGFLGSALIRSAMALMFSTVASAALGMVFWAAAARLFDTTALGRASAGASAITLLAGLAQLSLTSVFVRFLPTAGTATARLLRSGYLAVTVAALVLSVGFVAAGFGRSFLSYQALPLVAFTVAVAASAFSVVQDGVLTAMRRTAWVPVENVAISVAKLVLLPVLLALAAPAAVLVSWGVPVVAAVVVVSVLIFGRLVPAAHRTAGGARMPARRELASFLSAEYLNGILGTVGLYLPPVLVAAVLGLDATALFYLPWLLITAVAALLWNIVLSFTVEATADAARTGHHQRNALLLGVAVTVGSTAVLAGGAPLILSIAGHQYASGGAGVLRLLALSLPFAAIKIFYGAVTLMRKQPWRFFVMRTASSVLFLGSVVPLMDAYGSTGLAVSYLASEALVGLALVPTAVRQYRALSRRTIDDDVTQVIDLRALRAQEAVPPVPAPRAEPLLVARLEPPPPPAPTPASVPAPAVSPGAALAPVPARAPRHRAADDTAELQLAVAADPDQTAVLPRLPLSAVDGQGD